MKNNEIKIDGKTVTEKRLVDASEELINLSEVLELAIMVLEEKGYQLSRGDEFALKFFIQSKGLEKIEDALNQVNDKLIKISNSICPDVD